MRPPLSLDALAADPTAAVGLTPEARAALLTRCAVAMAALAAAMLAEPSAAPPEHPAPAWLTIREVAERLKLAPSYVYQLARRGDLPHVKRGKYVRVPADALAEWAARLERNGLNGSRMRHDVLAAPLRRKVARPSRLAA